MIVRLINKIIGIWGFKLAFESNTCREYNCRNFKTYDSEYCMAHKWKYGE